MALVWRLWLWNDCINERASQENRGILPHLEIREKDVSVCGLLLQVKVHMGSPGQKPCATNVANHVGLQYSTIGNMKLHHILASNTPFYISMDVRYNSMSLKNSYGAGQSASQANRRLQAFIWRTSYGNAHYNC